MREHNVSLHDVPLLLAQEGAFEELAVRGRASKQRAFGQFHPPVCAVPAQRPTAAAAASRRSDIHVMQGALRNACTRPTARAQSPPEAVGLAAQFVACATQGAEVPHL